MARLSHNQILEGVDGAVQNARDIRAFHRKRTKKGDQQRETDIRHALTRIKRVMAPIRTKLGRWPYVTEIEGDEVAQIDELRVASKRLQAERRKLWKLRGRKGRP